MPKRRWFIALALASFAMLVSPQAGSTITPGAPTTSVPTYLTDGSYLFGITVPPLSPDEFLLPVNIKGASNLQNWVFDLSFNNTVVQEVDPLDGTAGICR